jgi:signal transduction histidine kinase
MAERIDVLTATRAGAVDQQAAELRRIERDLHDGAQARLVALAMDLGMARERLADDPDAQHLVAGAHEQAKQAITELRDLARGIHPVVLTDRGLPAALATLAGASHIPVDLNVDTGERPAAAVEAAAYFVVAEALTNANKHSGATRAVVRVVRDGPVLRVSVADDGAGGADRDGTGLRGLRRRVEALDGVMAVASPPGGGTVVDVELPCGS